MRKFKQKGSSTVEFAIVLPLLLFLIFMIYEFGIMFYRQNAVTKSVQIAARYLSDVSVIKNNTSDDVTKAKNLAVAGTSSLLPGFATTNIEVTDLGDHVQVVANYHSDFITGNTLDALLGLFTGDDRCINFLEDCPDFKTLTATSVMRFAQ